MKIIIVWACILASGCAAQLTNEGRMVRQIQADWATSCDFLGVVEAREGNGWDVADDRAGALNSVRNQIASQGGNAFVLTQTSSTGFQTVIQADSYNCKNIRNINGRP